MWLKTSLNTVPYNITVNTLNDFRIEPLKRRLPSDVTFVTVLRHMCWTFSVRYNMYLSIHVLYMFVLLLIYHAK